MWQFGALAVFRGLAPRGPVPGGDVAIRSVAGDLLTVPCLHLKKPWPSTLPAETALFLCSAHSYYLLRPDGVRLPAFERVPGGLAEAPSFLDMVWPHEELACVRLAEQPKRRCRLYFHRGAGERSSGTRF